jgi:SAM-dependent methyltransferase
MQTKKCYQYLKLYIFALLRCFLKRVKTIFFHEEKIKSKCTVCQQGSLVLMEKKRDISGAIVNILICNHCSVIANSSAFSYGMESQDATESVYKLRGEVEQLSEQVDVQLKLLSYIFPFIGRVGQKTFLEIGYGKGLMLIAASQAGFKNVIGVDPFDNVFRQVAMHFPEIKNVITHHELDAVKEPVDCVFMWHTLEHLPAPRSFLLNLTKTLNPSALLFFQVPQYHSPYIVGTHFYFFNELSIYNLLSSTGFSILEIGYDLDNQFITVVARYAK